MMFLELINAMQPSDVTRYAVKSILIYCALTVICAAAALICLLNQAQGFAALLLCVIITLPGLALSKALEIRNMWQGKMGNARAENMAAAPGLASIACALTFVAVLVRYHF